MPSPKFYINKKKDRFEFVIFGKKITFFRYLRIIREIFLYQRFFVLRDTLKDKFDISLPVEAYYHMSDKVEIISIALKDIKYSVKQKLIPLNETPLFKALKEGKKYYSDNREGRIYLPNKEDCLKKFDTLQKSLDEYEYDPSKCVIALRSDNGLIDGYHRSVLLLHKYGENHKVLAVRVRDKRRQISQ